MPRPGDRLVVDCALSAHHRDLASTRRGDPSCSSDSYMDGGVAGCPPPQLPLHHRLEEGAAAPEEKKRSSCLPPQPPPATHRSGSSRLFAWAWWQRLSFSWLGVAWLSPLSSSSCLSTFHSPCCVSWLEALFCWSGKVLSKSAALTETEGCAWQGWTSSTSLW